MVHLRGHMKEDAQLRPHLVRVGVRIRVRVRIRIGVRVRVGVGVGVRVRVAPSRCRVESRAPPIHSVRRHTT